MSTKEEFYAKVVAVERKKLQAVRDKLPVAIQERNVAKVVGLAQSAERIAARLLCVLDATALKIP